MAKIKKPGQKNRVVHRPQLGVFTAEQTGKDAEVKEEFGYEVEVEQNASDDAKRRSEPVSSPKSHTEIKHTSPKVLLKPLLILVSAIGIMLVIKLGINLVS